jgi:hypothetical protein
MGIFGVRVGFIVGHGCFYSLSNRLAIYAGKMDMARFANLIAAGEQKRKTLAARLTPNGLAAIRRCAGFGERNSGPDWRECLVAWLRRQTGEVPEWLKGTDCKSVSLAYVGSNPTLSTTAGTARLAHTAKTLRFWSGLCAVKSVTVFPVRIDARHSKVCGYSSVVEQQPSKLNMRVRFPLPAPDLQEHRVHA